MKILTCLVTVVVSSITLMSCQMDDAYYDETATTTYYYGPHYHGHRPTYYGQDQPVMTQVPAPQPTVTVMTPTHMNAPVPSVSVAVPDESVPQKNVTPSVTIEGAHTNAFKAPQPVTVVPPPMDVSAPNTENHDHGHD